MIRPPQIGRRGDAFPPDIKHLYTSDKRTCMFVRYDIEWRIGHLLAPNNWYFNNLGMYVLKRAIPADQMNAFIGGGIDTHTYTHMYIHPTQYM